MASRALILVGQRRVTAVRLARRRKPPISVGSTEVNGDAVAFREWLAD